MLFGLRRLDQDNQVLAEYLRALRKALTYPASEGVSSLPILAAADELI